VIAQVLIAINLEYCASIVCIQYIFKFVYMGYDSLQTDKKVETYREHQEGEARPEGELPTVD
jgi:hypothetical protein